MFHQAAQGWQAGGSCPSVQCQEAAEAKGWHRPTPKALPGPQPGDHWLLLLEGVQDQERQVPGEVRTRGVPGGQSAGNLNHQGQEGQSSQEEGLPQRVEALVHTLNLPCHTAGSPSLLTQQIRLYKVRIKTVYGCAVCTVCEHFFATIHEKPG